MAVEPHLQPAGDTVMRNHREEITVGVDTAGSSGTASGWLQRALHCPVQLPRRALPTAGRRSSSSRAPSATGGTPVARQGTPQGGGRGRIRRGPSGERSRVVAPWQAAPRSAPGWCRYGRPGGRDGVRSTRSATPVAAR